MLATILLIAGHAIPPPVALADEPSATPIAQPAVADSVPAGPSAEELDRRLRALEQPRVPGTPPGPAVRAGSSGFGIASADGGWGLKLNGLVQADQRVFHGDRTRPLPNIVTLRRVRPGIDVTLDRVWSAKFVGEFAGTAATLIDASLEWRPGAWLGVRAGRMKPPVGYEQLQSDPVLPLPERGPVSGLVPNRDAGLCAEGAVFGDGITWAVGAFGGVADGGSTSADTDDDKDVAARAFLRPLKPLGSAWLSDFGVGVAGTYGHRAGTATAPGLPAYPTAGQQTWFSYSGTPTGIALGALTRLVPQAAWYAGRFGLIGEYAVSTQEIVVPKGKATRVALRHEAWQVTGTALVIGTKRGFGGVTSPDGRSLEVAGRITEATIDPAAFRDHGGVAGSAPASASSSARAARSWGAAVNWYPVSKVRISGQYERTRFSGGAPAGADREDEQVWIVRTQVTW